MPWYAVLTPRPVPVVATLASEAACESDPQAYSAEWLELASTKSRWLLEGKYAGAGKSRLALEALVHAFARTGERGVVVASTNELVRARRDVYDLLTAALPPDVPRLALEMRRSPS
jgi:hypothetical protein